MQHRSSAPLCSAQSGNRFITVNKHRVERLHCFSDSLHGSLVNITNRCSSLNTFNQSPFHGIKITRYLHFRYFGSSLYCGSAELIPYWFLPHLLQKRMTGRAIENTDSTTNTRLLSWYPHFMWALYEEVPPPVCSSWCSPGGLCVLTDLAVGPVIRSLGSNWLTSCDRSPVGYRCSSRCHAGRRRWWRPVGGRHDSNILYYASRHGWSEPNHRVHPKLSRTTTQ